MKLMNDSTCFKMLAEQYKVSCQTIWRQVRRRESSLGKHVTVEFKMTLKPEHKQARITASLQWLTQGINPAAPGVTTIQGAPRPPPPNTDHYKGDWLTAWAQRVIYLDAKKIYVKPEDYKVWGLRGDQSLVIESKAVRGKGVVLHYYAAVCYPFGGLLLKFVTGTKGPGYTPAKQYKVGYAGERCTRGVAPCMACRTASHATTPHTCQSAQCKRTTW
jgi:hypothetical protein